MLKYTARRLVYLVFVFFIVSIIMFGINRMTPGDPVAIKLQTQRQGMRPEQYLELYEKTKEQMGYNKPIVEQYFIWVGGLCKGDFGYSLQYNRPVNEIIGEPLVNTVKINLVSTILVFLITIPLGIATAVKKGSFLDRSTSTITMLGYSLPSFVFAILFMALFAVKLRWLPVSGMATPNFQGTALEVTLDRLKYMALPLLSLTFMSLAGLTRYVRTTMIEALREDYIRTARAKGLKERVVIYTHAFRNALIPFITVITGWVVGLFGGAIITETMFSYNGIGNMIYTALRQSDFDVVMSMNMFYVVLALLGNLIMDLAYGIADPRVRLA